MSEQLHLFGEPATPVGLAVTQAHDLLPPLAREMVRVMGEAATMQLMTEMGGLRLTVPGWPLKRASSRFERLQQIVGPAAAQAFAERWGGIEVQVPKAKQAMQLVRDRALQSAYDKGARVPDLARQYQLTEGQVWRVLKRALKPV